MALYTIFQYCMYDYSSTKAGLLQSGIFGYWWCSE